MDPFSRSPVVHVASGFFDCRKVLINVTVEINTTSSPVHKTVSVLPLEILQLSFYLFSCATHVFQELVVRLTDESDLFFLFTLNISEEDFQT